LRGDICGKLRPWAVVKKLGCLQHYHLVQQPVILATGCRRCLSTYRKAVGSVAATGGHQRVDARCHALARELRVAAGR
jgi:hypothetical protein